MSEPRTPDRPAGTHPATPSAPDVPRDAALGDGRDAAGTGDRRDSRDSGAGVRRWWHVLTRRSIARRFLTGAAVVVDVAVVTIFVVDALVSPAIFHAHLMQADLSNPETVLRHVEEGMRSSNMIALAVAILIAVLAALLVSLYLATRVSASLAPLAAAARQVAAGDYTARVDAGPLGAEFDELTEAVNAMSQRLASVEQSRTRLFSDLAHEMRTPIAVVQAQLEGIEDGVVGVEDSIPVLRAQAERLTRLSSDIGLLSQAQEHALRYEFAPGEVASVVRGCVDDMALRYREAGVQLTLDVATHARAQLDTARFAQVITNLLANALNATVFAGRGRTGDRGGHVHVGVRRHGNEVVVQVRDDGVGISPEELPHVFDRFARVGPARDRSSGGFGIGLTVARAIVSAHHGTISADSPGPGRGATFTVTVPVLH